MMPNYRYFIIFFVFGTLLELSNCKSIGRFSASVIDTLATGVMTSKREVELLSTGVGISTNAANTYGRSVAIGEALDKIREGRIEEARKDMIEFVSVLCLIDIPGIVNPAGEVIGKVVMDENNLKMAPVRNALNSMNTKASTFLTEVPDMLPNNIKRVGHKMSQFKGKVVSTFETGADLIKTSSPKVWGSLSKASKAMKTYNPLKVVKAAGVIDFLAIGYSAYSLGRAAKIGDVDSIVENSIAIAGGMFSMIAALAASGSALGPIGTVVGAILGGIACLISIFKPDPQGDLDANVEKYELLGKNSIVELLKDYAHIPAVNMNGEKLDWLFENNQGAMSQIKGLEPDTSLKFSYEDISVKSDFDHSPKDTCPISDGFPTCIEMGETRQIDKEQYQGWFWGLKGKQKLIYERDFYGMIGDATFGGTTIIVRGNLFTGDMKMRGISIDTTPPEWATIDTGDDSIVFHDMSRLANGKKINLILNGGKNSISINGLIGTFKVDRTKILDIKLQTETHPTPQSVISFAGMKNDEENLRGKISGMRYYTSHLDTNRDLFCYLNSNQEAYCPGMVDKVVWIASSPFNDEIWLKSKHDMTVVNKEGANKYIIHIAERQADIDKTEKVTYRILDSSDQASILEFRASYLLAENSGVVYREKKSVLEFYGKFIDYERNHNVDYRLLRRVVYAGSKHMPKTINVKRNMNLAELSRVPSFIKTFFQPEHRGYHLERNVKYDGEHSGTKTMCLCDTDLTETYYYLDLGRGFNVLEIQPGFFQQFSSDTFSVKLVYDKIDVAEDEFGWFLKIRRKDDPDEIHLPRHDLTLRNIAKIEMQDYAGSLFDFTDEDAMVTEIDLHKRRRRISFTFDGDKTGTDLDDFAFLFPTSRHYPDEDVHYTFDLQHGTDTVVVSEELIRGSNKLDYRLVIVEDNLQIEIKHQGIFGTNNRHSYIATVKNVERFACECYGLIRTLEAWDLGRPFEDYRDLRDECRALRREVEESENIPDRFQNVDCDVECSRQ